MMPKAVTDESSGEVRQMYLPSVGFKIKPKISVGLAETKGEYMSDEYLLDNEEGLWTYRCISDQITLFEE